jgi:hypothetical protein
MKKHTTSSAIPTYALKAEALASMSASFERFCLPGSTGPSAYCRVGMLIGAGPNAERHRKLFK